MAYMWNTGGISVNSQSSPLLQRAGALKEHKLYAHERILPSFLRTDGSNVTDTNNNAQRLFDTNK